MKAGKSKAAKPAPAHATANAVAIQQKQTPRLYITATMTRGTSGKRSEGSLLWYMIEMILQAGWCVDARCIEVEGGSYHDGAVRTFLYTNTIPKLSVRFARTKLQLYE